MKTSIVQQFVISMMYNCASILLRMVTHNYFQSISVAGCFLYIKQYFAECHIYIGLVIYYSKSIFLLQNRGFTTKNMTRTSQNMYAGRALVAGYNGRPTYRGSTSSSLLPIHTYKHTQPYTHTSQILSQRQVTVGVLF